MKTNFVLLILLILTFHPGSAQEGQTDALRFEVNRLLRPLSISREQLITARTLTDLNPHYQTSWVRKYLSVEILASYQGVTRKAVSREDTLSQEQKHLMEIADVGTDISVKVHYIPENTLKQNDPKVFDFTFLVNPEAGATFGGGAQKLNQYLRENAIDRIPGDSFTGYDLTAVRFTVDEAGRIIHAYIFSSTEDEKTDALLLEAIRKMPDWKPAEYADGTKVKQDFVLTVGNMENCMIPLLNIESSR